MYDFRRLAEEVAALYAEAICGAPTIARLTQAAQLIPRFRAAHGVLRDVLIHAAQLRASLAGGALHRLAALVEKQEHGLPWEGASIESRGAYEGRDLIGTLRIKA